MAWIYHKACRGLLFMCIGLFSPMTIGGFLSAEGVVELQFEQSRRSEAGPAGEQRRRWARGELMPRLRVASGSFLDASIILESIQGYPVNESYHFGEEGLFIEELKWGFDAGAASFTFGKFNPAFGIAWNDNRGIGGGGLAGDYEITERLGAEWRWRTDWNSVGPVSAYGAAFKADISMLSGSMLTERHRLSDEDGGIANTSGLESFVAGISVDTMFNGGAVRMQLECRSQAAGDADVGRRDETGFAVSVAYREGDGSAALPNFMVEYVRIKNLGTQAVGAEWITLIAVKDFTDQWLWRVNLMQRSLGGQRGVDVQAEVSLGFDAGNGSSIELGGHRLRVGTQTFYTLGLLVRHEFTLH